MDHRIIARARPGWLEPLRQDLGYATRTVRRTPWFTAAAVLTLTIGIAANSIGFSLIEAVILHPLRGVVDPGRLFQVVMTPLSYPVFSDYRAGDARVAELAGFANRQLAVRVRAVALPGTVAVTTGNYFSVLGATAAVGRPLDPADETPGAPPVAVLSDRFWRDRFGSDPRIVGRTVYVSDAPLTVVGVADPTFRGVELTRSPDLWTPVSTWALIRPSAFTTLDVSYEGWGWMTAIGRLGPGITLATAQHAAEQTAARELDKYPKLRRLYASLELRPLTQTAVGGDAHATVVQFIILLSGAVAVVLLIACTNVATLLLARAAHRRREIAVRVALGARSARLLQQLMAESALFAVMAGVAAVGVTVAVSEVIRRTVFPGGFTLAGVDAASPTTLMYAGGISLVTVLLAGLAPALHAMRDARLDVGQRASKYARTRLRDGLLVMQIALSLVLLVNAGLFLRGVQRALRIDLGFSPDHLVSAMTNTGLVRLDTARSIAYYDRATEALTALPGIRSVSWTATPPLADHNVLDGTIEGYVPAHGAQTETFMVDVVGAEYVRTLGGAVVRGREFSAADRGGAPLVAMVNEAFARHYWPGADPIGKHITLTNTATVVGLLRDIKAEHLDEPAQPLAYFPLAQQPHWYLDEMNALVQTSGPPEAMVPTIVRALRTVNPAVPVEHIAAFDDVLTNILLPQRFAAAILAVLGLMAIVVAGVGMYGVLAYVVSQRMREIGIRMALGAQRGAVMTLVLNYQMRRVVLGTAVGLAVAAAASRAAASLIYGVSPLDRWTYTFAAVLIGVVGLAAAYLPVRRAVRINPIEAIRTD